MDVEIKNAIDSLRAEVQTVDNRLTGVAARLTGVESRLTGVEGRLTGVESRLTGVEGRLTGVEGGLAGVQQRLTGVDNRLTVLDDRVTTVEATLRQEIREEGAATRRHFDVVAESLRDDIRIIAEGLIALDAKVETMRHPQ